MTASLTSHPAGLITPYGSYTLLNGVQPSVAVKSPDGTQVFNIMGGRAPILGTQPGVLIREIEGLFSPFRLLDQQGARQDGVTNMGHVLDPIKIKMSLEVGGRTPGATMGQSVGQKRREARAWIDSWLGDQLCEFSWETPQMGKWWGGARWAEAPTDKIPNANNASQQFQWTIRIDAGVYQSYPSTSKFPASGTLSGSASGWMPLTNRGSRDEFPVFACYGPFDLLSIANGPGNPNFITFGPLLANQLVLLNTDQRLPLVVDLSRTAIAAAPTTQSKNLLTELLSFVTNNDAAPLLQQWESQFGILPPQTTLEALVTGRFTNPVPAKPIAGPPATSNIAVSVTGATSATRIVATLFPSRRYPE